MGERKALIDKNEIILYLSLFSGLTGLLVSQLLLCLHTCHWKGLLTTVKQKAELGRHIYSQPQKLQMLLTYPWTLISSIFTEI